MWRADLRCDATDGPGSGGFLLERSGRMNLGGLKSMPRAGFEPAACALGERRSILLSYRGRSPDYHPRVGPSAPPCVRSCPLASTRNRQSRADLA